jgi:hypothetical protein
MTTCRYINSGQSNFELEYIGEFETEFKTILEYESGGQVGSICRKKQRAKISCYCPFKRGKKDYLILLVRMLLKHKLLKRRKENYEILIACSMVLLHSWYREFCSRKKGEK